MHVSLKTSIVAIAIALLLAAPSTKADPVNISHCFQDYRACIASGFDPDSCRDEYYYCRFGYYPARSSGAAMIPTAERKD